MIEVKAGEAYEAKGTRNGDGWSLFKVKAEKGPGDITVFTDRCMNLEDGQRIRVDKILAVKKSARKVGDKWYDTFSCNAECAVCAGAPVNVEFEEIGQADGDLPF